MAIVPFAAQSYDEFPESRETCEGMRSLAMDKSAIGVDFHLDVPYAERDGRTLHLQIFVPVRHGDGPDARYPLGGLRPGFGLDGAGDPPLHGAGGAHRGARVCRGGGGVPPLDAPALPRAGAGRQDRRPLPAQGGRALPHRSRARGPDGRQLRRAHRGARGLHRGRGGAGHPALRRIPLRCARHRGLLRPNGRQPHVRAPLDPGPHLPRQPRGAHDRRVQRPGAPGKGRAHRAHALHRPRAPAAAAHPARHKGPPRAVPPERPPL